MYYLYVFPPADICVPDVDGFVSERIPNTDGALSPFTKKKGGRQEAKGSPGRSEISVINPQYVCPCLLHVSLRVFCVCFRSGRESLLALIRLLGRSVLRPSLLDSHLQARATWRTGLHAKPTQGEPWSGAVPALSLWGRTHLPDTARTQYPTSCSVTVQLLGNLISLLLRTVFRLCIISGVQGKASCVSPI